MDKYRRRTLLTHLTIVVLRVSLAAVPTKTLVVDLRSDRSSWRWGGRFCRIVASRGGIGALLCVLLGSPIRITAAYNNI